MINLLKKIRLRKIYKDSKFKNDIFNYKPFFYEKRSFLESKSIKICIINFWDGAFEKDFLDYFFRRICIGGLVYVNSVNEADVVISSHFGSVKSPRHKTIFFSGESYIPNFEKYIFSISQHNNDWNGHNVYLPLWYSRLAWNGFNYENTRQSSNGNTHGYEELINKNYLLKRRKFNEPKKFCVIFASSKNNLRTSLYNLISTYKNIDGYGKVFDRPFFSSKEEIYHQYKFCLCPENSFLDGYVTEKLIDAWSYGCIPIYYGKIPENSNINTKSFINFSDFDSSNDFMKKIKDIDSNYENYCEIYNQNFLNEEPDIDYQINLVSNFIENILRF